MMFRFRHVRAIAFFAAVTLAAAARLPAQQSGSWTGQLFAAVVEGGQNSNAFDWYLRQADGTSFKLILSAGQASSLGLAPRAHGSGVSVSGILTTDPAGRSKTIQVASISLTGAPRLMGSAQMTGSLRNIVLNCQYSDKVGTAAVPATFWQVLLGTSAPALDHYFREVSANQLNTVGSSLAPGTFTLPGTDASYNPGGNNNLFQLVADCVAAADPIVDFSPYDGVIVQVNGSLGPSVGGIAFTAPISITADGTTRSMRALAMCGGPSCLPGQNTVAHEIGHTTGLLHSGGSPGAPGYPYDSYWDVMSGGHFMFGPTSPGETTGGNWWVTAVHMLAFDKFSEGWIPQARVFSPGPGTSTTITLERSALPVGSNYLMAIVQDPTTPRAYYTVELRMFAGYDQPTTCVSGTCVSGGLPGEGVVIARVDSSLFAGDAHTYANIVDGDGNGNVNDAGAIWVPGEQYTGNGGVTIQVASIGATSAQVTITTGIPLLAMMSTSPLASGVVGQAYSQQLIATGGLGSYAWSVASGSTLPTGLTLSAAGLLSGTPTAAMSSSFTLKVSSGAQTVTRVFQLAIYAVLSITTTNPITTIIVGQPYSYQLQASGGTGSYTWTFLGGGLYPGLNVSASGLISGTVQLLFGPTTFTVGVASGNQNTSLVVQVTMTSPIAIASGSPLPNGTVGLPYAQTLQASGGVGTRVWAVQAGSTLPTGLTLDAAGNVGGTPTVAGASAFTLQVTSGGQTATKAFGLTVNPAMAISTPSPLPDAIVGTPYLAGLSATGANGPLDWTLPAGSSLPAGLTLNSSGFISGTAAAAGTSTFVVRLSDGTQVATKSFTLNVIAALTITTTTPLPGGTVGQPYSQQFNATGGGASRTWTLQSGSTLPAGLSLSTGGLLSGTPTSAGGSLFVIQVTDGTQTVGTSFLLIVATNLAITTPATLPDAAVGQGYGLQFNAAGGTAGYSWTLVVGSVLPPGFALSAGGQLSGVPTTVGTTTFSVKVTSGAQSATQAFTLTVNTPVTITTANTLPGGAVSQPYSQQLAATGGSGGYVWSVLPGSALPAGVTLSAAGLLSGTPSAAGTTSFALQVLSGALASARTFSLTVAGPVTIITTSPLPVGVVSQAYSQQFAAAGGSGGYIWAVASGSALPAGLSLTGAGTLSGSPAGAGSSTFSVQVTSGAQTALQSFTLLTEAQLSINTSTPLPGGTVGQLYSQQLAASGGSGVNVWTLQAGSVLPSGLTLTSTGLLNGTPGSAVAATFTIQVSDGSQATTKSFSLTIAGPVTITSTSPLPTGVTGAAYAMQLSASGGNGSYSWAVAVGSTLTPGLSLSTSGMLSGTPTTSGAATFTLQVTSGGQTAAQLFSLTVNPVLVITTTSPLPGAIIGQAYSQQLVATGGTGSFSWSVAAGSTLPASLALSAGGALTGVPTSSGASTFSVVVSSGGQVATQAFSLTVIGTVTITSPGQLPAGIQGQQYSQQLAAAGGNGAFTWSVAAGSSLPPVLGITSGGLLNGTLTSAGNSTFTLQVTSAGSTATQVFTLPVLGALTVTTPSPLPVGTVGQTYTQTLSATGGSGAKTWALASGSALPTGLALAPNGTLAGTPAVAGISSFVVEVTSGAQTATATLQLTIGGSVIIVSTSPLASATLGHAYTSQLVASGGNGTYAWSIVSGGSLPAGLSMSASGGITGIPGATGTAPFTIQVSSGGQTVAQTFQMSVETGTLVDEVIKHLLGTTTLSSDQRAWLDTQGNANGVADLGDLLALLDRNPGITLSPEALAKLHILQTRKPEIR